MAMTWKSHRGDEWWYEAGSVRAEAGFGGGTASIDKVEVRGGAIQPADLHRLLCSAIENFEEAAVVLDVGAPGLKATLASLEAEGLVRTKPIEAPYSKQVRVLSVQPTGASQ